ncbi:Na+/H+ antiporter subunit E [Paracraurococcus ruber]|uniref:Na+/H+ antiporter subunit E n=1 Tax=Paracraurococcus ruber TaxID=77675 RepID=A0ABS1D6K7_9PROT|nr:Na+/H+ antiporter subunit E [Paracraurococcus ruber]MBK1662528.1 Na+/H+ antiporter subunit E [Paracraurococcus ruber]TDG25703.1 Na+/H+ antiporter subunit E [Paracraurococcus ruber]
MRRVLPYPLIALALLLSWLVLAGSASLGTILLGGMVTLGGSWALASLAPPRARLRRLAVLPGLLRDVLVEVVRSNNAVARIILDPAGQGRRQSGFVQIPLDMRSPQGLAALACILTATPGTVWVEYDSSEGIMLLHVLDLVDASEWVRIVKEKWERRLMEIFE